MIVRRAGLEGDLYEILCACAFGLHTPAFAKAMASTLKLTLTLTLKLISSLST